MTCSTLKMLPYKGSDAPSSIQNKFTFTGEVAAYYRRHERPNVEVRPQILRWKKHQNLRGLGVVEESEVPSSGPAEQKQLGDWGHWNNTSESANVNICF